MIQNPSIAKVSAYVKSLLLLFISIISYSNTYSQKQTVSPVYTNVSANIKAYYESLPVDYAANPSKKYPLIVFLHGVGELGAGTSATLPKVKANSGLAKLIDKGGFPTKFTVGGKDYSFIVIAPQFSTQSNYTQSIDDLLAHVKAKYRVDVNRIYLTGLSMGGGMAHDYGSQRASTIAAILPICPAFSPTQAKAEAMANAKLPVWITVNSGDSKQYPTNAKDAIAKLKALYTTSTTPWITVFEKSGHDAWTKTYDPTFKQGGYNVYEWMLLHARSIVSEPAVTTGPPTAKAGVNQTITLPTSTASLDASGSAAASGASISSYVWSKVSGPAVGAITSASAAKTTATGLTTAGTYVFEVKVTDNKGKSATARVTISVKPKGLTASAGSNQTVSASSTTLDASSSAPASGTTIASYQWTKVSGPSGGYITSPGSVKTTITGLVTGTYVYQVKVTSNLGSFTTASVTITVKAAAAAPTSKLIAKAGDNQAITLPVSSATLDGSGSIPATGTTIASYQWTKVSGPSSGTITSPSSAKTTVTGLAAGTYVYQLKVTSSLQSFTTDQVTITVKSGPLTARAGDNQTITLPTSSVALDASASTPAVGTTIAGYNWTKVSGPVAGTITSPSSAKTTVTGLTVAGTYVYEVRVTSNLQSFVTDRVSITVNGVSSRSALVADAGENKRIYQPTSSATLDGSGSQPANGTTISSYHWTKVSGPSGGNISSPNSAKTNITGLTTTGTYLYELRVMSSLGSVATDRVSIDVSPSALTARAGSNQTITLPTSSTTLDGSGSTPAGGTSIASYGWRKVSGPSGGNITSPTAVKTTITSLNAGTYVYELRVTSNLKSVSTATVTVIVKAAASSRKIGEETADVEKENPAVTAPANDLEVKINPNPVTTSMNVWVDSKLTGKTSVQVYSITGVLLMQKEFTKGTPGLINQAFDVSSLPRGIYVVYVTLDGKQKKAVQIIKQ